MSIAGGRGGRTSTLDRLWRGLTDITGFSRLSEAEQREAVGGLAPRRLGHDCEAVYWAIRLSKNIVPVLAPAGVDAYIGFLGEVQEHLAARPSGSLRVRDVVEPAAHAFRRAQSEGQRACIISVVRWCVQTMDADDVYECCDTIEALIPQLARRQALELSGDMARWRASAKGTDTPSRDRYVARTIAALRDRARAMEEAERDSRGPGGA